MPDNSHLSLSYGLALDTTTANLSIALSNFADDTRSQTWHLGRELSSELHLHLQTILKPQTWLDLKFIAVAKGPGSFTSIRIGVITARTLGQQLQIPVYGISNLVAIAWKISRELPENQLIAVQMNAKREQVFCGIYRFSRSGDLTVHFTDSTMNQQQWLDQLQTLNQPYHLHLLKDDLPIITDSLLQIGQLRHHQELNQQQPNQQQQVTDHWATVLPFYGQNPVT